MNINPKWVVNHYQYKHARSTGYSELRVTRDNGDGTFTAESLDKRAIYTKLKKRDFYFFDFV